MDNAFDLPNRTALSTALTAQENFKARYKRLPSQLTVQAGRRIFERNIDVYKKFESTKRNAVVKVLKKGRRILIFVKY